MLGSLVLGDHQTVELAEVLRVVNKALHRTEELELSKSEAHISTVTHSLVLADFLLGKYSFVTHIDLFRNLL